MSLDALRFSNFDLNGRVGMNKSSESRCWVLCVKHSIKLLHKIPKGSFQMQNQTETGSSSHLYMVTLLNRERQCCRCQKLPGENPRGFAEAGRAVSREDHASRGALQAENSSVEVVDSH